MLYFLYPQLRKLSGAERLILRLASHVSSQGRRVTLLTNYCDPVCRSNLDPRVTLVETGRRVGIFGNHYLDAPLEYIYSIRLLSQIGKDAEAIVFFGPPSLTALAWSKRFSGGRAPALYFCYEPPRFVYDDTREVVGRMGAVGLFARPVFQLYKILDRAMARRADVLLANSEFGAARLRAAYGLHAEVITHGVDLSDPLPSTVETLRARLGMKGKCVVLGVNFMHPRKRIDLFLRAFHRVRDRVPNAAALLVGSGPEVERLKALTRELGVDDAVLFAGFVPDEELSAYYSLANLYLHTGKLESFGLSVLEASASGLPVVSVNEGGPREIIADGVTGMLVEATPASIAETVAALLEDGPRRLAMGEAGRSRVRRIYNWDRGAQTLLDVVGKERASRFDGES